MTQVQQLSYEEALAALQQLEERDKVTPFVVGDIVYGLVSQSPAGKVATCKNLAADLGRSLSWVQQREMVAAWFPPDIREVLWAGAEPPPPLTWVHHRIVVYTLETAIEQRAWIRRVIEEQLSTRQLQELLAGERPDSQDDIVITHDQVAGELHVLLKEDTACHVQGSSTPGVLTVADGDGATTAIHVRLPETAMGRKARLRRVR